ncbi:hypothetical protein QNM99_10000 [Pseudomonas sp. PCH446]
MLQLTHMAKATAGYYPLGRNNLWHGGVHFDSGTPKSSISPACIAWPMARWWLTGLTRACQPRPIT